MKIRQRDDGTIIIDLNNSKKWSLEDTEIIINSLCYKALHYCITNPGKTVLIVSKTLPQAKDHLRQIKQLLERLNSESVKTISKTERV